MRAKKDPSKLKELSPHQISGKVADLMKELQEILKKHPGATIQYSYKYDACYYEGDTPECIFTIRSK